jgi:transaldolase
VPIPVFEESLIHPLTIAGIKTFDQDWKKLDVTKFP